MASFKFDFFGNTNTCQQDEKEEISWLECSQVIPNNDLFKNFDNIFTHAKMFTYGDVEIGHVLVDKSHINVDLGNEHSDLVPGKYEGGYKVWECTYDLIAYVTQNQDNVHFKNKTVLDLGCGAGLLGIYAFLNGSVVTFQDYNKEVIEDITIPNVMLNIQEEDKKKYVNKFKFYYGDWASFNEHLSKSELFDIIFTSETIYNIQNYNKLINLLTQRLNKNGTAYVAAKTYYFGVGGGTRQFEAEIEKTKILKSEVVWKTSDGIQREILKINHIQ